ncbi:hypothetical protein L228DRAFT_257889 [Xylona heveae TC161]|uniref:PNPLA domain-containing protein n=1 Tax=Xylona heveae (strain CBS 132557 / TC161) TaxID=1328760 RepID=A0A165JNG4_XYLHT|nr:hypothetical protein L228DRAFT_257889 [Xylona heveae TC161]KZF26452.1 hypothetical protein L228DRAFT_257889 [Xylona heveae TC161]
MLDRYNPFHLLASLWALFVEVAVFWRLKLVFWWRAKRPRDALLEVLADARVYEEWEGAAYQLDELLGNDLWRQNPTSKYYDYRLIYQRLQAIIEAREDDDIPSLVNLLRSGLVRNLGNISAPRLFNRAYAGTKLLIEDYITQVALAIEYVTALPTSSGHEGGLTSQAKLDLLHDTRQAFGRSALVLQGGAIFGLCHLGVVKALHLRGLLPRIIVGTATGALIAALVGIHTEDELLGFLSSDAINLTAFAGRRSSGRSNSTSSPSNGPKSEKSDVNSDDNDKRNGSEASPPSPTDDEAQESGWYATLMRRIKRFIRDGYFLDINVLEACVRDNVGDLTFEEAYARTKRVLNITVSTDGRGGVPNLLNYLTAPNVLIWSAALASNASSSTLYSPVVLKCKDETGAIVPWASAQEATFRSWTHTTYRDRDSPLTRVAELFNVNHFVVSQARPYLAPFLRPDLHRADPRKEGRLFSSLTLPLLRLLTLEVRHRLEQLDSMDLLSPSIRRFLITEDIPSTSSLTLVPELTPSDFFKLLENPTKESIDYWIMRGERSVWPAVGALRTRCAVEVELDRAYQHVRRKKPLDLVVESSATDSNGNGLGISAGGAGAGLGNDAYRRNSVEGKAKNEKKRGRAASLSGA